MAPSSDGVIFFVKFFKISTFFLQGVLKIVKNRKPKNF